MREGKWAHAEVWPGRAAVLGRGGTDRGVRGGVLVREGGRRGGFESYTGGIQGEDESYRWGSTSPVVTPVNGGVNGGCARRVCVHGGC